VRLSWEYQSFFRWLSERYPLINQTIDIENPGPAFDSLYLDMNGIIHNCSHGDYATDIDRTEEEMFMKIFSIHRKSI